MLRETFKWKTHENQSTDAKHRGGLVCSSAEASVMGVERRDQIVQRMKWTNQRWEEFMTNVEPQDSSCDRTIRAG